MYNSDILVRDQPHVEQTPRRTDVIRFEAKHDLIRVDRPEHLAQRSYCDIQGQVKAIVSQTDRIDVDLRCPRPSVAEFFFSEPRMRQR